MNQYLNKKEDQYFDRKSARIKPNDVIKHIIAFANAEGGTLVIGIEDDGELTGTNYPKAYSIDEYQLAIRQNIRPLPKVEFVKEKIQEETIYVIEIESSSDVLIRSIKDDVYLRIGDKSVQQNHSQVTQLEYAKGERIYEDKILSDTSIVDINKELLAEYKMNIRAESMTDERVLKARGFMKDGNLTVAGILLFGQNTFIELPQSRLRILRYDGIQRKSGERLNIVKDLNFEGPIPYLIREGYQVIKTQLREFQFLGPEGKFLIVDEYPEFAWFEGIVNALVHRDYSFTGDYVRVSIYDDRLEIFSPGSLPNVVTLDNMRFTRYARNPRMARALTEFGWVRELNEGVNRIYDEMAAFYLEEPKYSEPNKNSVSLQLKNNYESRRLRIEDRVTLLDQELREGDLNDNQREIIAFLFSKQSTITVRETMGYLSISRPTARRLLIDLVEKNILVWRGNSNKDPKQYYMLDEKFT